MTIEDLTVGYLEGHTLPVVHRFQPCYPDSCQPVTFSVAAAPMPSDCGECETCTGDLRNHKCPAGVPGIQQRRAGTG